MNYPLLNVFLTMMWVFLWVLWFVLLFRVISDLFRNDSLSGWAKAAWTVFVIVLPFLGVFVYLIVHGRGMGKREIGRTRELAARYGESAPRSGPPTGGRAEELTRLAELKAHGDLTADEFERAKAKVLTG